MVIWEIQVEIRFGDTHLAGFFRNLLVGLNSNEWSIQACPDLKWEFRST